jgi:hypothetical protein
MSSWPTLTAAYDKRLNRVVVTYTPAAGDAVEYATFQASHSGGATFGPIRDATRQPIIAGTATICDYEIPPGPATVGYRVVAHYADGKVAEVPVKNAVIEIDAPIAEMDRRV